MNWLPDWLTTCVNANWLIFRHLNFKKCAKTGDLHILTYTCASRHNGVQFFDIRTSKSAPRLSIFHHFDLWMCFSPQQSAIFRHQNLQKCSETVSFLAFWLGNVLRATAACNFSTIFRHRNFQKCFGPEVFCTFSLWNALFATAARDFSTSELQKVLRTWGVLYIFTSKCAFRHSGMQFLISPLTTWLRTRRFNRPTFRLTGHTDHWKNTAFRDFSNIWRGCIFFLLTFALFHLLTSVLTTLLLCFSSAFQLSILSEVSI